MNSITTCLAIAAVCSLDDESAVLAPMMTWGILWSGHHYFPAILQPVGCMMGLGSFMHHVIVGMLLDLTIPLSNSLRGGNWIGLGINGSGQI